jgi:hypothetical protein
MGVKNTRNTTLTHPFFTPIFLHHGVARATLDFHYPFFFPNPALKKAKPNEIQNQSTKNHFTSRSTFSSPLLSVGVVFVETLCLFFPSFE